MGRALECFRRVAREADLPLVKALAQEREFVREALQILYTPYARRTRSAGSPIGRPEGMRAALGIFRTLPRAAEDAARAESSPLRVSEACYGYLAKYNLPAVADSLPPPPVDLLVSDTGQPPRPARHVRNQYPGIQARSVPVPRPCGVRSPQGAIGESAAWHGRLVKMARAP